MLTGNKPKLTLGLKKKPQNNQSAQKTQNEQSQATAEKPKLILGLRKKAALVQPLPKINDQVPEQKQLRGKFGLKRRQEFRPQHIEKPQKSPSPQRTNIRMPKTVGRLEINIKITELPNWVEIARRGWRRICLNVEGRIVQMTIRPKVWNKLLNANEEYPNWVASITGTMGHRIKDGFELVEPAIQVYGINSEEFNSPELEQS